MNVQIQRAQSLSMGVKLAILGLEKNKRFLGYISGTERWGGGVGMSLVVSGRKHFVTNLTPGIQKQPAPRITIIYTQYYKDV